MIGREYCICCQAWVIYWLVLLSCLSLPLHSPAPFLCEKDDVLNSGERRDVFVNEGGSKTIKR